jgi:hypothetical protein
LKRLFYTGGRNEQTGHKKSLAYSKTIKKKEAHIKSFAK